MARVSAAFARIDHAATPVVRGAIVDAEFEPVLAPLRRDDTSPAPVEVTRCGAEVVRPPSAEPGRGPAAVLELVRDGIIV